MADNKTGYCRPPVEHRFKPGQSGNPAGRPKKKKPSSDEAEIMRRFDSELISVGGRKMIRREAELRVLKARSAAGVRPAMRLLAKLRKRIDTGPAFRGGVVTMPASYWNKEDESATERNTALLG